MDEIWKQIPGEQPCYEVSNTGGVRSIRDGVMRPLKPNMSRGRYIAVVFFRRATPERPWQKVCRNIHRLVAEAFLPNPENKPTVNHKDGNKHNNRADNLEWVTTLENYWHAVDNNLLRGKAAHIKTKLSDTDVADIRKALASGQYNMAEIAEHYKTSRTHVSRIWRNLDRMELGAPIKPPGFRTTFYHRKRRSFTPEAVGQPTTASPQP